MELYCHKPNKSNKMKNIINKEIINSVRPDLQNTFGYNKEQSDEAAKEFDRRARWSGNYRHYCRNMNNRDEKEKYAEFIEAFLGDSNLFLATASAEYLSEERAVFLMSRFQRGGNYLSVVEKADKFHLHYIGRGKPFAKYIETGLRFLPDFKADKAVDIFFKGTAKDKINYLLKGKHNNLTHIDYFIK
jgi:hypothetical protein